MHIKMGTGSGHTKGVKDFKKKAWGRAVAMARRSGESEVLKRAILKKALFFKIVCMTWPVNRRAGRKMIWRPHRYGQRDRETCVTSTGSGKEHDKAAAAATNQNAPLFIYFSPASDKPPLQALQPLS